MKTLSETWFAEGYIDFELKKYTLLAYLQEVNRCFDQTKLYPQLADVVFHYNNILAFRDNKKFLEEHFPKKLTGIQLEKLQLLYEQMIQDIDLMQELEEIINYAAGKMQGTIQNGSEIYEFIEEKIVIMPVGLIPLDIQEGYFMLSSGTSRSTHVYEYRLSIFEKHDEKYRSMRTHFVDSWQKSMTYTFEGIKTELLKTRKNKPVPAVYSIETELTLPLEETLLPIAKRSLVKYISQAA